MGDCVRTLYREGFFSGVRLMVLAVSLAKTDPVICSKLRNALISVT